METVTWITGSALLVVAGGLLNKLWNDRTKVPKAWCDLKHNSLETLLASKFETVNKALVRIEGKVDKLNGKKS